MSVNLWQIQIHTVISYLVDDISLKIELGNFVKLRSSISLKNVDSINCYESETRCY